MAELKPVEPTRAAEGSPRVVPLDAARPQPGPAEPARDGVSWRAFGIAVALLVFATAALIVQTQRVANQAEQIGALSGQVEGLEVQLSGANAQLTIYHSQLGRIRTSVSAVVDQVANLNELVQANPFAPPAAPTAAAESPAAR